MGMPNDIKEIHDLLSKEVIHLSHTWETYKALYAKDQRTLEILDWAAPSYFHLTQSLFLDGLILQISRLIDPPETGKGKNAKKNLCLERLLNCIDLNGLLNLHADTKKLVEEAKSCSKKLQDLRNKTVAHLDFEVAKAALFSPLTMEEVQNAINSVANVLNYLLRHFSSNSHDYQAGKRLSAEQLICRLEQAKSLCDNSSYKAVISN